MSELEWTGHPEQSSLRRALRHGLRRHAPSLRVIAEDFLADTSPIDLLGVGSEGELVSVRIGDASRQAELLTQGLADLAWLRPRARDLVKLAPALGLEPSAEPRTMLFCPRFDRATRAATEILPRRSLQLFEYRCLQQHGQLVLLFEPDRSFEAEGPARASVTTERELDLAIPLSTPSAGSDRSESQARPAAISGGAPTPPQLQPAFRTGLTDADLEQEPPPLSDIH